MPNVKFESSKSDQDFHKEIKQGILSYFKTRNISIYGNFEMYFKCTLWILLWGVTWYGVIYFKDSFLLSVSAGIMHMFCHLMIAFNVVHDANHDALFKSKRLNTLFGYFIELLGSSRRLWVESHNIGHHSFVNVHKLDNNIDGYGLLRLCPHDKWLPHHKYQWLYAPLVYSLSTLNYATVRDLKQIAKGDMKKPISFYIEFFVFKSLYYSYLFIIPIFLFNVDVTIILAYFFIGHFISGLILSVIFIIGHLTEGTSYPNVEESVIHENWAIHIIKTTCDYATKIKALEWLVGGINLHIAHHLFPRICHVHYKNISDIIKRATVKHKLIYREIPSFRATVASHFRLLKELGTK